MSRRLVRVNPLATLAIVLFYGIVWVVSFCGAILLSGIGVYLLWLLGRFLIG
jgi:hypothetical protein